MDAREGRTRRGNLQPDRRILRNLDGLERLLPGLCRLVMQVEAPRRFLRVRPDTAELLSDARFGVFRQCNVTAENMQDRRFAPVVGVAEIQVDRPILAQLRTGFDLYHGPSLGIAMNAGGKPVGALTLDAAKDRNRADNAITAAVERQRSPVDKTVDVTIGPDPKHQNAPVHAADPFVDGGEPFWNVALDRGSDGRQSKFNRR